MRLGTGRRLGLVALVAAAVGVAAALAAVGGPSPDRAAAASHREAPEISLDPSADITDFFMFRSYEPGNDGKVVLIMDVFPGSEPSSGPNYFTFDPNAEYSFGIDNNGDGHANDVTIDFRFDSEIRGAVNDLGLPLSYVALPPITKLDGPGSEGLGLRQSYRVSVVKRHPRDPDFGARRKTLASGLIAVPSNVGPRTMPNYGALAAQGVYDLGNGIRVFAGQRQDPFYIDLGAVFDTLNLRRGPPLLSAGEDAADGTNSFGVDMLSGFNVQTIAIELPASLLTADAKGAEQTSSPTIGAYAYTSRPSPSVRGRGSGSSRFVQVQRLANPLVNEVIIGTKDKDYWNRTDPEDEVQFLDYYKRPRLALAMELVFGFPTGCTPFGTPDCAPNPPGSKPFAEWNRDDLINVLLKSPSSDTLSELLRLNVSVDPTPLASQKRLTILAGDNAGWPNGRRPRDDVTDVAFRVVGGPNYLTNRAGDGVNVDDAVLPAGFPFLAEPADGRDLVSAGKKTPHQDP